MTVSGVEPASLFALLLNRQARHSDDRSQIVATAGR